MATTFATPEAEEMIYFSFPIARETERNANGDTVVKWEKDDKGHIVVKGVATDGSVDSDEQIVDPDWSAKALSEWLQTGGNVRMAHDQFRPVGKGLQVELNRDGDGKHWVKSLIVNNDAKTLVEEGVLTAYSVGIARPVIKRDQSGKARGGIICGGQICELSIVDRPANKSCYLEIAKSDSTGAAEYVGKLHGATVTKSEQKKFSPADLAAFLKKRAEVEKRDMDPDVGGGTDRDKIPAADFAGRNRSFPIVTPGDVSDAASSIGRAGDDNYSSEQLKENIIRIARRKGPSFVAELPDSWTNGDSKKMAKDTDDDTTQDDPGTTQDDNSPEDVDGEGGGAAMKGKKKKPFPGAAPSFDGQDSDGDGKDTDKPGSEEDDDEKPPAKVKPGSAQKGEKDCPNCGRNYHADSKQKRCESCNAKLPKANKSMGPECGKCGCTMGKDHKFCPECGSSATKAAKPTPDGGAVARQDIEPVPAHREPDGSAIEALESDMHIPTTPDAPLEMKAALRLKSLGVPSDMGVLHDLTCAAYHPDAVKSAYPDASLSDLDVVGWQTKALDAATGAPLPEALAAQTLWQHAVTLKGADPETVEELRFEAHKSFADANPGPATFPKPTELSATTFRRPLITSGHAAQSPGHNGPNSASVPSGSLSANQFDRPFIQDGQAADSPSNKGDAVPAPVPTGEPSRVYYRNTQRDHAKTAMQAMHDHIANTFPDLCPMSGNQDPVGQNRPVPVPQGKSEGVAEPEVLMKGTAPDLVKSMMQQVTAPLMDELRAVRKELKAERKRSEDLQKAVDALGKMADPTVNAFKGVAFMSNPQALPVEAPTADQLAARAKAEQIRQMEYLARTSPNSEQREAYWRTLDEIRGLTPRSS